MIKKLRKKLKNKKIYRSIKPFSKTFKLKRYNKYINRTLKKVYYFNFKKKVSNALIFKKYFFKKVDIRATQNNFFCTFSDLNNKKILHAGSGGIYKIKISKRKFKRFYENILSIFFIKIKKYFISFNNTVFNIIAPIRIKKKICKFVLSKIKKSRKQKSYNVLINVVSKKCFNGCRAKKKIKKKRRLYRIYK